MIASKGIVIAATGSGIGKTSIACGLLRAMRNQGIVVRAAKCGPDYLDPMWLSRACGSDCPNLDPWMAGADGVRELATGPGLLVVETAMGLYDGIRPESNEGSGAEVAGILGLPILLVVDASGSARTVAAVVQGMRDFGPSRIVGVIANRVGSAGHAQLVSEALASRKLPRLVGFLVEGGLPTLPERHLGLVPPESSDDILERMAEAISSTLDLAMVQSLAGPMAALPTIPSRKRVEHRLRLGLAWDDAFRFAYGPVIARLEANGVEIVRFSPLRDASIPVKLDGLWLCGGYPEAHARELADNRSMRDSVAGFCASGKPVLAECGGLLYLATDLVDQAGTSHGMCGVVPAKGIVGDRLRQLGYRTARAKEDLFVAARGSSLRGHEFHYGTLEGSWQGDWRPAFELDGSRGNIGPEGWWNGSVLATWLHGWLAAGDSIDRWIAAMDAARERSAK